MISYSIDQLRNIVKGRVFTKGNVTSSFSGISTDSRKVKPDELFIPLIGDVYNGHDFLSSIEKAGVKVALCQENVNFTPESDDLTVVYVKDTLEALQRLATYYRDDIDPVVIGITGSNGKTTTKDMLAAVCATTYNVHKTVGTLNNHFGLPLTLLSMPRDTKVCIVEMGMNHFGEISLLSTIAKPNIAIITNIGDSHIEFFGSRDNIAKAKLEILDGLSEKGTLVYNGDEPLLKHAPEIYNGKVITFGEIEDNDYAIDHVSWRGERGMSFGVIGQSEVYDIPMLGRHNTVNALAAIAVGDLLSVKKEEIVKGLSSMVASKMRVELINDESGMIILNDAYNASPTSMKASLRLLDELPTDKRKWALLGDILELGSDEEKLHREVGVFAASTSLSALITVGKRGCWIHKGILDKKNDLISTVHFESIEQCAAWLLQQKTEDVILLMKASRGMAIEQVLVELEQLRRE